MLVSKLQNLALLVFTAVGYAADSNIRITVTSDNRVQIDIPASNAPYDEIDISQDSMQINYLWEASGSQFLQCSSDTDCTPFDSSAVITGNKDTVFQAGGTLNATPNPGNFVRYLSPPLEYPKVGIFQTAFDVFIQSDTPLLERLTATIYKLAEESLADYTYIPTTICQYNECVTTSLPEQKVLSTTTVGGIEKVITSYSPISYNPITIQSYLTSTQVTSDGIAIWVTTYCPLTDTHTSFATSSSTSSLTPPSIPSFTPSFIPSSTPSSNSSSSTPYYTTH